MKTIAILNLKGGVAKTTTAINMAAIMATEHDQRVLLVDADSQGDATKTLLPPGEYNTLADLLLDPMQYVHDLLYRSSVRGLDVLPSDFALATVGMPNVNKGRYSQRALLDLRDELSGEYVYDYIIIDCPSSFIHPGAQAAVLAADEIIVPVKADAYSISGAAELAAQVDCLRSVNPGLRVAGCVLTMYYRDEYVDRKIAEFTESAPVHIYNARIRRSAKADGGTESAGGIMPYSPRSAIARDTRAFVAEYLGGEGK